MSKNAVMSKTFAIMFMVLTFSAIAGLVTMVIMYNIEIGHYNVTAPPTVPPTTPPPPPPVMRLPKNLVPESYRVFLRVHLYTRIPRQENVTSPNQTLLFDGNSTVFFYCDRPTRTIYLHSRDQTVENATVMNRDQNRPIRVLQPLKFHQDQSNFLEIMLDEELEEGMNYSLFVEFRGHVSENLEGLFLSTYHEGEAKDDGNSDADRFLVATNLEPTETRTVFPCFDEPAMKAKFNVTIIHRKGTTALGNEAKQDFGVIEDDWEFTEFKSTDSMSTYLLAFTVSELNKANGVHRDISTYARPEATAAGYTAYADNVTGHILSYYQDYFGVTYKGKLDQVALPDLGVAGMENWGLVTYQEAGLFYEEGVSSWLHKGDIATLIAHELAHQWFGNLVTMKWWNEVWLNEGFATFMSFMAVDRVESFGDMKDIYFMSVLHAAFEEDALASSHPLNPPQQEVQTTLDITEMFDTITYCKGAALIRMLANVVGEADFQRGIRMYLSEFQYKNTDQDDLWGNILKALQETGKDFEVEKYMKTWTLQTGFPVVTINTTTGDYTQKRFLFNDSSASSELWYIPYRVMSSSMEPTSVYWIKENGRKEEFGSKEGEWILMNVNSTGYYRVNYDPENWQRLLAQLATNPKRIPVINRGQLIDDAFNLARAKMVDVTLALNFTQFLRNEKEFLPWESAVRNLKYFVLMFDRSEVYGPMQAYLREQVKELYNFFKNDTDSSRVPTEHSSQYNQINAIQVACSNGLPECLEMAADKFALWMESSNNNDNDNNNNSTNTNTTTTFIHNTTSTTTTTTAAATTLTFINTTTTSSTTSTPNATITTTTPTPNITTTTSSNTTSTTTTAAATTLTFINTTTTSSSTTSTPNATTTPTPNITTTTEVHPNLRSVIYCQALAVGGKTEWEFAWAKFQSSNISSEKEQLRAALSCTKTIWLLNRYLEYTLDPEKIRLMDVASTINSIAQNEAGQALAWNFIRAHWDYVSQLDGASLIEGVTSRFSTQFELEELEAFAAKHELGSASRAVDQAIEQTRVNIRWVKENREKILEWFETAAENAS